MQQQQYQEMGATAACTRRLCEAAAYSGSRNFISREEAKADGSPESFVGDSWFTGIKVAEWASELGHSYFGALKTSTKYTPFQDLIDKMQNWPSGSYLVMECTTPDAGHKLICIGYKYSASKVLVFLGTKKSGSTIPGEPYVARFPDANGNVAQRNVPRPDVISKYFNRSNVIDTHNQARQYELALEKRWIVESGYFRIATTILGMTVIDCWRAYKHAMDKEITVKEFADRMAYDCLYNCHSASIGGNAYLVATGDDVPNAVGGGRQSDVSNITEPTTATTTAVATVANVMSEHPFKDNPEREQGGTGRPKRRVCRAEGCEKTYHKQCFHRQCLQFKYMSSQGWVRGVFYCPDHYHCHYAAVLEGNGNV
jgi:hypothetical protein